jgi:hypothetical protein
MAGWFPLFAAPAANTAVHDAFSPALIVKRLSEDPEYFQRLATYVAAEFGFAVQKLEGRTENSVATIRSELVRQQEGFAELAQSIAHKAYDKAAAIVISLRDGLSNWWAAHPDLVESAEQLAVISLGFFVLTQIGGDPTYSLLAAVAVVRKEKLSDLLKGISDKDE